jgi:hypothetical protein
MLTAMASRHPSAATKLDADLQRLLSTQLNGESVRWFAQPDATRVFWAALPIYLFAIPWTVFSVFWEVMALGAWLWPSSGAPPKGIGVVFGLFGIPFVMVGFAMLATPFYARWQAQRTVVALTEKRLAVITASRGRKTIKSIFIDAFTALEVTERKSGSGTLKLLFGEGRDSDGDKVEKSFSVDVPDIAMLVKHLYALRERG